MTMIQQISTTSGGMMQSRESVTGLTTEDALRFLRMVKHTFPDKPELYDGFIELLKDFRLERIDTAFVVTRVKELFQGHPKLFIGFNAYLPDGYKISVEPEDEQSPLKKSVESEDVINFVNKLEKEHEVAVDVSAAEHDEISVESDPGTSGGMMQSRESVTGLTADDALRFVRMVKHTFPDKPELYDGFIELLKDFRLERIDTAFVVTRVKELFQGHPKLFIGFNAFLPDGHKLSLEPEDEQSPFEVINFADKLEKEHEVAVDVSAAEHGKISVESDPDVYGRDCENLDHGQQADGSVLYLSKETANLHISYVAMNGGSMD